MNIYRIEEVKSTGGWTMTNLFINDELHTSSVPLFGTRAIVHSKFKAGDLLVEEYLDGQQFQISEVMR